ncbi:MAG: ATP-binding protein [Pirellulales bacterium]
MVSVKRGRIVHFLPAPLVLVLGIVASIGGYALIERIEILESVRLDTDVADRRIFEIEQEFDQIEQSILLLRTEVQKQKALNQTTFHQLSQSILDPNRSVSSVEWVERVKKEELSDYLARVEQEDRVPLELTEYGTYLEVRDSNKVPIHNIVRYVNSRSGFEYLRGLDRQLYILDRAVLQNQTTSSSYRDLALANPDRLANAIIAPIYDQDAADLEPQQRELHCIGCVVINYEINKFTSLNEERFPQVAIRKISEFQNPQLIFMRSAETSIDQETKPTVFTKDIYHSKIIKVLSRRYWIGCFATPLPEYTGTHWSWTILFIGLICTFFSAGIVVANSRRATLVGIEVEKQTHQLKLVNSQLEAEVDERRVMHEQLIEDKVFLQYLLSGHERDRQLIAYEIHDGVVQGMTAALMFLESVKGKSLVEVEEADRKATDLIRNSIVESRRVMKGLSPPLLEDIGVIAALEGLAGEQSSDTCTIYFTHDVHFDRLLPLLECTIYRIVQEGITNIIRHSQASKAEVRILEKDHQLHLSIQDNGKGFDPLATNGEGFGIKGIQERAKLFDTEAKFQSTLNQGTTISVSFPTLAPGAEKL